MNILVTPRIRPARIAAMIAAWAAASFAQAPAPAPSLAPAAPSAPALVAVAAPRTAGITGEIALPASLEPFERVSLYGKLTGFLTDLSVDVGDAVKTGQVVAKISIPEMERQLQVCQAQIAAAKAEVAKAQANVNLKKVKHDRLAQLYKTEQGAVAELDVEIAAAEHKAAEAEMGVAQSRIASAQADSEQIKTMMGYRTIAAPFDGVITQRWLDNGSLVQAAGPKAIVEVMRVSKLRMGFDMPERIIACLNPQQKLRYTIEAIPGKSWEGALARTTGSLRSDSRTLRGQIDVDNASGWLYPGQYGTVRVPLASLKNVAAVPAPAVRSAAGQASVLSVVEGRIKRVPVIVLIDDGKEAVVSGELSAQIPVITAGPGDMAEGQPVQIRAN